MVCLYNAMSVNNRYVRDSIATGLSHNLDIAMSGIVANSMSIGKQHEPVYQRGDVTAC